MKWPVLNTLLPSPCRPVRTWSWGRHGPSVQLIRETVRTCFSCHAPEGRVGAVASLFRLPEGGGETGASSRELRTRTARMVTDFGFPDLRGDGVADPGANPSK